MEKIVSGWPLVDQLVQQGVTDFFLAPGSRSTPLAIALSRHPLVRLHRHFDERALGFYAMGFGLGSGHPAAVVVTSGTAVGNLTPAVMEAHHASTPLIVIAADRPAELRETSANQTSDQLKMFANFVRWEFDLDSTMPEKAIRSKAAQAALRAKFPHPGPVHINCPQREPLYPMQESGFVQGRKLRIDAAALGRPSERSLPSKGIILIGRLPKRADLQAVLALARRIGWPVFADILSNARLESSEEMIRHYDWLFWSHPPRPECVLHFGERLTSKRLMEWLSASPPPEYIHVSPHAHWNDPHTLLTERIAADIAATCEALSAKPDPAWLRTWVSLEARLPPSAEFTETSAICALNEMDLGDWAIFLANSMPIREGDWFLFPRKAKGFFANRGLSGIDGNIATVAGLSLGLDAPVIAILGDVTTLHDLNSLALLRHAPHPIILIVSNNDGCGIFSHLAVANDPHFDALFGFSHGLGFEHAAHLFGLPYAAADCQKSFEEAMRDALAAKRSMLIEVKTSRKMNHAHHQRLRSACSRFTTR